MKNQPEYLLQCQFVRWMTLQHRGVMVFSDTAAHIAKTVIQQGRANKLQTPGEKWPDVFVAQPSGDFAGLFLAPKAPVRANFTVQNLGCQVRIFFQKIWKNFKIWKFSQIF